VDFEVIGSQTGHDGKGNNKERFVSNSKRTITDPSGWVFFYKGFVGRTGLPAVGFEIRWAAVALSTDTCRPVVSEDATRENVMTLVQGVRNGPHVLRLEPTGDEPLAVAGFRVYRPPLGASGL